MACMVQMTWPEATTEQYDALRKAVNWEQDKAEGGIFHVAAFDEAGAHITDVWESPDAFQRFSEDRLMPAVEQLGIPGAPEVQIFEAHAVFALAYE